jgi:quercetin dioxygenase-like cupin family protein
MLRPRWWQVGADGREHGEQRGGRAMGELKVSKVGRRDAGAPNSAAGPGASNFEGDVRVVNLVGADESGEIELLAVYFPAGGRTRPHIHERDQALHFIEGQGIVATASEKVHTSAGDVVTIPAGTWHWHGAERDVAATHISIKQPGPTNWDVDEGDWVTGYSS